MKTYTFNQDVEIMKHEDINWISKVQFLLVPKWNAILCKWPIFTSRLLTSALKIIAHIQPYKCYIGLRKIKVYLHFLTLSTGNWNPCLSKTMIHITKMVNVCAMAVDGLGTQRRRVSAATILNYPVVLSEYSGLSPRRVNQYQASWCPTKFIYLSYHARKYLK